MAITQDVHDDLCTRLDQLVQAYAAASDLSGARAKLAAILERLPVGEAPAASGDTVPREAHLSAVDEIDRLTHELDAHFERAEALTAENGRLQTELDALKQTPPVPADIPAPDPLTQ